MAFVFSFGEIYSIQDDNGKVFLIRDVHAGGQTFRVLASAAVLHTLPVEYVKTFTVKKSGVITQIYGMRSA